MRTPALVCLSLAVLLAGNREAKAFAEDDAPEVKPFDTEPRVAVAFTAENSKFGIACTKLKDPRPGQDKRMKLLTSEANGSNNNTRVRIDGYDFRFGTETPNVKFVKDKDGLWKEKEVEDPKSKTKKWVTKMKFQRENVIVSQEVMIVMGEQTRFSDTVLVKYVVENNSTLSRTIGVRMLFDTYVGANDGVPFEVGPSAEEKKPSFVDTMAVFEKNRIPVYLRAIEKPGELAAAENTVAEMGLKLRGFEPLTKVVICRWPKEMGGSQAGWDWKFEPMNANPADPDSCVVLYWEKIALPRGDMRTLGFSYGLGRITGEKSGDGEMQSSFTGKLRLFASPAKVGNDFAVTAYLKDASGEVKLALPDDLELVSPEASQKVPAARKDGVSVVSWLVKAKKPGTFTVAASLADGTKAKEPVTIGKNSRFD